MSRIWDLVASMTFHLKTELLKLIHDDKEVACALGDKDFLIMY